MSAHRGTRGGWGSVARPWEGRVFGGVCLGLAEGFRIDPTLIRLAFLLLALAHGIGIVLYAALWVLIPVDGSHAEQLPAIARENLLGIKNEVLSWEGHWRNVWNRTGTSGWPRPLGRQWVAIGLIAGGGIILLCSFGVFSWLTLPRVLGLLAIIVGVGTLISMTGSRGRR